MSWFGTERPTIRSGRPSASPVPNGTAVALAGTSLTTRTAGQVRGARYRTRGTGASRYALLDRVRGKRWGELPAAPPTGRHTSPVRFVTESAKHAPGRSAHRPGVVIIATPCDLLAQLVATSLVYAHVPVCQLAPDDLAEVELEWHGRTVTINGQSISGLLWRALVCPDSRTDSDCVDPKITASWLAAASFPSMRAVNAYDPDAWHRGAGWSVWEDRLGERGVPVQPPPEPHSTSPSTPSLIVCGKVVSGPETGSVVAAAQALESSGVRLASVTCSSNGRVTGVDTQPKVSGKLEARRAAARVADYLAA